MPSKEGRIAHNGWANCNSPLHVCYPNVGKYTYKSCKYTKKRRHGHGMRAFACVVGAKSASWRSGVCDAIRPHRNLPILQIHLCFQLPLMGGRIALKGRANCPQRKGELPTMDGRIAIRPYTCIFWMLANLHVIKYKYTCEYLNTCKLMIERIYIPT